MTVTLDHLLTRTGTLLRRVPSGEDALGDFTYTVVEDAVACELQQAGSGEEHEGATQTSRWRVWLPAGAGDLGGWDAIRVDGQVYELDGDPAPVWHPPSRSVHHVEAEAVRVR